MPLFGSLKADELLMHLTAQCLFFPYDVFLYQYIYLYISSCEQLIPLSYIYICLSELPSSSFIIDFRYCEHVPQVCHLPITIALLKSYGHQYCSHASTNYSSYLQPSLLLSNIVVACRMCPFHV